jgi:hypothetical protein
MENEVLPEAIERRQRFLKNKENAERIAAEVAGDINADSGIESDVNNAHTVSSGAELLISQSNQRHLHLFFDDKGHIQCITAEPPEVLNPLWYTYDFSQEVLKDIKARDPNKFWITTNPETKEYVISSKPIATLSDLSLDGTLCEIMYEHEPTQHDISVRLLSNHIEIELSKTTKEQMFSNTYPIGATIKGKRILKFVVAESDVSKFVYQVISVSLSELLSEQTVIKKTEADFRHFDVYTIPLFDKYIRTV